MKALFVCSIGGHLTQLYELRDRIVGDTDDVMWVTHDSSQSRSVLRDQQTEWMPRINERDVLGVLRTIPRAWRTLRRERPDIVVSTGAAIALAFLPVARLLGIRTTFIESAAMTHAHTRTGLGLQYVPGIQFFSQSRDNATGRWQYMGSVFDSFSAVSLDHQDQPARLVVTVGTSKQFGFRSLIERVLQIAPPGTDILWQTGSTDVSDLPIQATPWLAAADLEAAMADADAVISHAGCGSALAALSNGKRPILVPRRAALGEFNDDHQEQIAAKLTEQGLVSRAYPETLEWGDVVDAARWSVRREFVSPLIDLRALSEQPAEQGHS